MKFGVLVFPGSNCDHDSYHVLKHVLGLETRFVWHQTTDFVDCDALIVPGGFSFGDYLRCGAIAKFSPVMTALCNHAERGGPVLGICNGFQILQECGLLPGSLLRNARLKFLCQDVYLRTETTRTAATGSLRPGQILRMPIAHNEGNFFLPDAGLAELSNHDQVVFRYCDRAGQVTGEANPNGSVDGIAGVCNRAGNVVGLMPHPERAAEALLGSDDGLAVFRSLVDSFQRYSPCRQVSI